MKLDEIRERLTEGKGLSRATPVHFWAIPCPDDIAVADMGDLIEQDLRERFRVHHLFVRTWLHDNGDGTSGVCARVYDHCPSEPDDYDVWREPPEGHLATLLVDEQPEGSLRYGVEVGSFQAVRALFVPVRRRNGKCEACGLGSGGKELLVRGKLDGVGPILMCLKCLKYVKDKWVAQP